MKNAEQRSKSRALTYAIWSWWGGMIIVTSAALIELPPTFNPSFPEPNSNVLWWSVVAGILALGWTASAYFIYMWRDAVQNKAYEKAQELQSQRLYDFKSVLTGFLLLSAGAIFFAAPIVIAIKSVSAIQRTSEIREKISNLKSQVSTDN